MRVIKGITCVLLSHPAHKVINPVSELDSRCKAEVLLNLGDIGKAVPDVPLAKRVLDFRFHIQPGG